MMSADTVVTELLARYSHREAKGILPSFHLERDLHLHPLELALVAVEFEEATNLEVPVPEIATMSTVGELLSFFSRAPRARH
jgi:hypothetical protein